MEGLAKLKRKAKQKGQEAKQEEIGRLGRLESQSLEKNEGGLFLISQKNKKH